jgi:hypothetical protein
VLATNDGPLLLKNHSTEARVSFSASVSKAFMENLPEHCQSEFYYDWSFSDTTPSSTEQGTRITRTFKVEELAEVSFPLQAVVELHHPSIRLNGSCIAYTQLAGWARIAKSILNVRDVGDITGCNKTSIEFAPQQLKNIQPIRPEPGQILAGRGIGNASSGTSGSGLGSCFAILRRVVAVHEEQGVLLVTTNITGVSVFEAFEEVKLNRTDLMQDVVPVRAPPIVNGTANSTGTSTDTGTHTRTTADGDVGLSKFVKDFPLQIEVGKKQDGSPMTWTVASKHGEAHLQVETTFTFNPSVSFSMHTRKWHLNPFQRVDVNVGGDLSASIHVEGGIAVDFPLKFEKVFFKHDFTGGLFWVDFVPIQYMPSIEVKGVFELQPQVGIEFSFGGTYGRKDMLYGFHYDSDDPASPTLVKNKGEENYTPDPIKVTAGCSITASLSLETEFILYFYDALCDIRVAPTITLEGKLAFPPPKTYHDELTECKCDDEKGGTGFHFFAGSALSAGAELVAGITPGLDILGWHFGHRLEVKGSLFELPSKVMSKSCPASSSLPVALQICGGQKGSGLPIPGVWKGRTSQGGRCPQTLQSVVALTECATQGDCGGYTSMVTVPGFGNGGGCALFRYSKTDHCDTRSPVSIGSEKHLNLRRRVT